MHHDTKGGEICTNNLYMTDTVSSSLVFYRLWYHTFPIRVSNLKILICIYLNNYFNFHICLSICVSVCVRKLTPVLQSYHNMTLTVSLYVLRVKNMHIKKF